MTTPACSDRACQNNCKCASVLSTMLLHFGGFMNGLVSRTRNNSSILICLGAILLCVCQSGTKAATVAYWRFEPGNLGFDSSGNGHDLTINGITSSSDRATNAPGTGSAVFNGISSFAQTVSTLDLTTNSQITIECFVKTNGQSSLGMLYEHTPDINTYRGGFYFDFNEVAGRIRVAQSVAGTSFSVKTTPYPIDSDWHHYAMRIDETGVQSRFDIYIDGVLATNVVQVLNTKFSFLNDFFFIGARGGASFFFNGKVDEIRISNKILDPAAFLIAPPVTNASIVITQQPTNTTVLQNRQVAFTVGALLQNGSSGLLDYQWQTNGVDIPGATASTYTIPVTSLGYNGVQFSVKISVDTNVGTVAPMTSSSATLTVQPDLVPPAFVAGYGQVNTLVDLYFNELLDPVSAADPSRYNVSGGIAVQSAQLKSDGQTVRLTVDPLTASTHLIAYTIADLAGNFATNTVTITNAGFTLANIGTVPSVDVLVTNSSSFTVVTSGRDIFGAADGCSYLYKSFAGDFDIRVRIENIAQANNNSRGGLMAREDTTAGSRNIFIGSYGTGTRSWVHTDRLSAGGTTSINGPITNWPANPIFPNNWVRLTRVGEAFATYYSTNGLDWKQLGSSVIPSTPFPNPLMVGIAGSPIIGSGSATATFRYSHFENFSVTNGTVVISSQPANTNVLAYRPVTFTVGANLQGGDSSLLNYQWLSNGVPVDGTIGNTYTIPQVRPESTGAQIRVVVSASGVAPVISNPATLTVIPDTVGPVAQFAYSPGPQAVAIFFDELLDANIVNNPSLYSVDGGFSVLSAQLQSDGKSVLLSVDGLNAHQFQITFNGVTDLSGNAVNGAISGANTGLAMADINDGFLAPAQITGISANGFTVNAAGRDIFGAVDSFNFVYEWLTNDFDVRVQFVNSTPLRNGSQRGGLMIRQDFSQGSPNVFVGTYAPGGVNSWVVTERANQDATTTIPALVTRESGFAFPNAWLRLKRSGQSISCYESTNGYNWVQLSTNITDIVLPDAVPVGIASVPISTVPAQFQYSNYGATVPLPQLQINMVGANLMLRWPTNTTGFVLQASPSLATDTWTEVTNAPVLSGGYQQVTLPTTAISTFYRLKH